MTGMVTEIERFALNDGPGIRTTVFLKGCDMNCAWCHNPETIRATKDLHYYPDKCISCYQCVTTCLCKAHKRINNVHRYFPNLCVKCGKCAQICYAGAMVMSGIQMSVEEVMHEVVQDIPYYRDSGGGVTISGGEVLCQMEFAQALTQACKQQGISVAIETNLHRPFDQIRDFLSELDLIMCDLKLFDAGQHKKWTGVDNVQILNNFLQLDTLGVPYIVRTPMIPGATDGEENVLAISNFLKQCKNLQYYELLNFNPLGKAKYASLSKKNPFADVRPLPKARMEQLKHMAEAAGIPVRIE